MQESAAAWQACVIIVSVFTGDTYRVWSSTSYVTRSEEVIELAMLLRYCVNTIRIPRLAVFITDSGSPNRQEVSTQYYLTAAGYVDGTGWFCVLYDVSASDFVASHPRGVVVPYFHDYYSFKHKKGC